MGPKASCVYGLVPCMPPLLPARLRASAPHFISQATGLKVIFCLARMGQSADSYKRGFWCQSTYIFISPYRDHFYPTVTTFKPWQNSKGLPGGPQRVNAILYLVLYQSTGQSSQVWAHSHSAGRLPNTASLSLNYVSLRVPVSAVLWGAKSSRDLRWFTSLLIATKNSFMWNS